MRGRAPDPGPVRLQSGVTGCWTVVAGEGASCVWALKPAGSISKINKIGNRMGSPQGALPDKRGENEPKFGAGQPPWQACFQVPAFSVSEPLRRFVKVNCSFHTGG